MLVYQRLSLASLDIVWGRGQLRAPSSGKTFSHPFYPSVHSPINPYINNYVYIYICIYLYICLYVYYIYICNYMYVYSIWTYIYNTYIHQVIVYIYIHVSMYLSFHLSVYASVKAMTGPRLLGPSEPPFSIRLTWLRGWIFLDPGCAF